MATVCSHSSQEMCGEWSQCEFLQGWYRNLLRTTDLVRLLWRLTNHVHVSPFSEIHNAEYVSAFCYAFPFISMAVAWLKYVTGNLRHKYHVTNHSGATGSWQHWLAKGKTRLLDFSSGQPSRIWPSWPQRYRPPKPVIILSLYNQLHVFS